MHDHGHGLEHCRATLPAWILNGNRRLAHTPNQRHVFTPRPTPSFHRRQQQTAGTFRWRVEVNHGGRGEDGAAIAARGGT